MTRALRAALSHDRRAKSHMAMQPGFGPFGNRAGQKRYVLDDLSGQRHEQEKEQDKCLGIPGRITAITDADRLLAMAEVSGVRCEVKVACVAGNDLSDLVGRWVLIHLGFAMSLIDEDEAAKTLEALRDLGEARETLDQVARSAEALA